MTGRCSGSNFPVMPLCTGAAGENLVIDSCPVACGQQVFENLGIRIGHFVIADYGVAKGKTEIAPQLIDTTASRLGREVAGGRGCATG